MNPDSEFESLVPAQSFNRRNFIVTSLGAGFALAVQPVMAQTAIRTDDTGLQAGEVKVPVKDGEMVAYRAVPKEAVKAPVVLVISEIFGAHEHIRDVCRRLAKLGYCAIAPELFARQGDPRQISSIPDILAKITSKTPDAQVMSDLDATVAWAARQGADTDRLAITGFCWGGTHHVALLRAQSAGQGRRGLVWTPGWRRQRVHATASHQHRRGVESAGARFVWWS